jgi:hypothetical protein
MRINPASAKRRLDGNFKELSAFDFNRFQDTTFLRLKRETSAGAKARRFFGGFTARLKPCPDASGLLIKAAVRFGTCG